MLSKMGSNRKVVTDNKISVTTSQKENNLKQYKNLVDGNTEYVLILQEQPLHPNPMISKIIDKYENMSILRVNKESILENIKVAPIFNTKYLVLFESRNIFKRSAPFIKLDIMFPVILTSTQTETDEACELCRHLNIRFKYFKNEYTKSDAYNQIEEFVGKMPSDSFCDKLISTVGLNPRRIISGLSVLADKELTTSNVIKYVDKYTYISSLDIIMCLFGMPKSKRHLERVKSYLSRNRYWFSLYLKKSLESDMKTIIKVYEDILNGKLTSTTMISYIEEEPVTRKVVLLVEDIYRCKTYLEVIELDNFVRNSTPLKIAMALYK